MSEWEYKILRLKEEVYGLFLVRLPKQAEWRLLVKMTARSDVFPPTAPLGCVSATEMARALGFDGSHASQPAREHVTWDQFKQRGAETIAETIASLPPSPSPGSLPQPLSKPSKPAESQLPVVPPVVKSRQKNWPAAIADRLRELREGQGQEYRDVLARLNGEFGTSYSLSAVKAKAARMKLSNYLEIPGVQLAPPPLDSGEGKASTPEEEGDVASPGPQPGAPPQGQELVAKQQQNFDPAAAISGYDLSLSRREEKVEQSHQAARDSRESPATFYPKVKVPTTIYDVISFWKYQGQAVEERPGGKYMLAGSTEEIDAAELVRRANTRRRAGNMEPFVLEAEEAVPLHTEAAE